MPSPLTPWERLALLEAWGEKCCWCHRPLAYSDLEVEHLVPKGLQPREQARVLTLYGLPADFDVWDLENLGPSCRRCNSRKGRRPLPEAPIVLRVLTDAQRLAPRVRQRAHQLQQQVPLDKLIATLAAAGASHLADLLREASTWTVADV
jgi:hypothetical protein